MTKKSKLELYPIKRVEEYEYGKVKSSYWVVVLPGGGEMQFASYEAAEKEQQNLKPKGAKP